LWDIVKNYVASVLFYVSGGLLVAAALGLLAVVKNTTRDGPVIVIGLLPFILICACILGGIGAILIWCWPLHTYNGREDAMRANTRLLRMRKPRDHTKCFILSTRMSFWPVTEDAAARREFREELTKKIRSSDQVRRIWHIHDLADLQRLEFYLNFYRNCDNLSIKYVHGDFDLFPEILIVYGKVASLSFPQAGEPRRLATAFHFRGRKEINRCREYFNLLWEYATPVKIGEVLYEVELESLRARLAH
jgi:hypothetical protein